MPAASFQLLCINWSRRIWITFTTVRTLIDLAPPPFVAVQIDHRGRIMRALADKSSYSALGEIISDQRFESHDI